MDKQAAWTLNDFFSQFRKLSFKKGETIVRAYDEPHGIFYLKNGYARLYTLSKNAQDLTFIIYKPGDFFPMIWPINKSTILYSTEAVTAVEAYQIPQEQFLKFIKDNNEIFFEITSRLMTRFAGLLRRMEYAMFGNARNKVASIILICADRFGKQTKDKKEVVIQVPLTHQDIANLLGVARETVSIEMKKLQENDLISYQGKYLLVKNIQTLKEESVLGS